MPPERFVEPSRVAVAAKVHGGLDGAAGFDEGERVFQPQAAQASGDGFAGLRFEIAFQVAFVQPDSAGDFGDGQRAGEFVLQDVGGFVYAPAAVAVVVAAEGEAQ